MNEEQNTVNKNEERIYQESSILNCLSGAYGGAIIIGSSISGMGIMKDFLSNPDNEAIAPLACIGAAGVAGGLVSSIYLTTVPKGLDYVKDKMGIVPSNTLGKTKTFASLTGTVFLGYYLPLFCSL